jgi:endonuclease/exonuclease/phosphatase family metal-dependent hydrolase
MIVVTWNIQWGLGADGRHDLARVVEHARSLADFDVLCLQEVADNFPELKGSAGENGFAGIAALLPGFTAVEGVALDVPDGQGRRQRFGNLLLSRLPVGQVIRTTLPWEQAATRNMPRGLIEAVVEAPFGPVRLMTTHLEYSSDAIRQAQVATIRETHRAACDRARLGREAGPGTYVIHPGAASAILTGDFNMTPDDPTLAGLSAPIQGAPALRDAFAALNPGAPHSPTSCVYDRSYREPHCCDYVYVSEDLVPRLRSVRVDEQTQVSDHQPVVVELDDG